MSEYYTSWISVPTTDLAAVLAALKARRRGSARGKVFDLTARDEVVAFVASGHTFVVGGETGMGADGARASLRFGSALSFHLNLKRGIVLAFRYEQGNLVREVSEITSEFHAEGEAAEGEPVLSGNLGFAELGALSRAWGAQPFDTTSEVDVVVLTTSHERGERTRRALAIGLGLAILAALAFAFTLVPSEEERCIARCEHGLRMTYEGSIDCPGGLQTCAPYLDAVAHCPDGCGAR